MNKFLFELGTEEIPAGMIQPALDDLRRGFETVLREQEVPCQGLRMLSSPRRLTVLIEGLPDRRPDREEVVTGPPKSVATDEEGQLTRAARGFARKVGVEPSALEFVQTEKGEYLARRQVVPGRAVKEILAEALPGLVSSLAWPRNMYWRDSRFRFIRPLRWFVVLWNSEVVNLEFEGLTAGRVSRGHRFLGRNRFEISGVSDYERLMKENFVLVDLEERRAKIRRELDDHLPEGLKLSEDSELLDLVCYLNEFPAVVRGSFSRDFLSIPQEVLVTVMRHHQKYFAVTDESGTIQPWFLTVVNTCGDPDGVIRKGHERVLKARLEDGAFFWKNDQKQNMADRAKKLDQVVFQKELGTYSDKTRRIQAICRKLDDDPQLLTAASLCKADLTTEMVFEMPELQGIMGGLYARAEGYPEGIWKAIYEHYRPISMEDRLPSTRCAALLSLADKLDTILGCFGIGFVPTGSRDPFALRRLGMGVIRVLLEFNLDYPLEWLVEISAREYGETGSREDIRTEVLDFLLRRFSFILREKGIAYDVVNAIESAGVKTVSSAVNRALALEAIRSEADFEALAIAFKRVRNILAKQSVELEKVDEGALAEKGEIELHRVFAALKPQVQESLRRSDFLLALRQIATLRQPVDTFFDEVLVMTDDLELRQNRFRILLDISELFLEIADISQIVESSREASRAVS